jgi:hypothetical protein
MNHPRLSQPRPASTPPACLRPVWPEPPRLAGTRVGLPSLAALLLGCLLPALATTYHVSPSGSDTAAATVDQPFATVQRALEAIHAARDRAAGEMTVIVAGGRYELSAPIRLDAGTSGVHGQQLVIRAAEGQTPLLSGGRRIEGWTLHDAERGIYRAPAPSFGFRQLYVNGNRAIRARHPNRENDRDMAPWFRLRSWNFGDGKASISVRADDVKGYESWGDMDGVEIVIARHWDQHRMRVSGAVEESEGVVRLDLREPEGPMSLQAPWPQRADGQPYFLENANAFLDAPGEWYLDRGKNVVFYQPSPGEDIRTAEVYAPYLQHLLRCRVVACRRHVAGLQRRRIMDGAGPSDGHPMGLSNQPPIVRGFLSGVLFALPADGEPNGRSGLFKLSFSQNGIADLVARVESITHPAPDKPEVSISFREDRGFLNADLALPGGQCAA